MKSIILIILVTVTLPLFAKEMSWLPTTNVTVKPGPFQDLLINGRAFDIYQHGVKPEWGYKTPQQDIFIVVHPKKDRKNAPLYVVLHSAGHDVLKCLKCTGTVGDHDIYHSPDDFYGLYLDCRFNKGDWWWGGMYVNAPDLIKKNSGGDPMPVERRVIDVVKWTMQKYNIDPERVYLAGISMGGSGTLGIGMRNGDVFAAIKANVPAGIEHVSNRMYFPPQTIPAQVRIPDPPVCIDYSAPNDQWAQGHERFVKAMNDRRYALFFYWGAFGHAHENAKIVKANDLINSLDWLSIRKNEAYPVFCNASSNQKLPWPDDLKNKAAGQVNAFFRWKTVSDKEGAIEMSLFLVTPAELKTTFELPGEVTADVSLRRIQNFKTKPDSSFTWTFGSAKGAGKTDAQGLITIPRLKMSAEPTCLTVSKE